MQKTKRLLSLFLCLLMLVSVFAVDASAIQYVGGDSTIGSASSGSSDGFAIWDGNLGNQFYIVGYRFSAVDSKGTTLKDDVTRKSLVIDLIRFGEYKEGSSYVKWGTSAYDTNRMAGDMRETRWLTTRNNKFQWAQAYKNGSGSISVKTTTGKTADNGTMGLYYAQASLREDFSTSNGTKPSSYGLSNKTVYSVLPYTSNIKSWMKDRHNFAYVANALGYTNVTASNLTTAFGADKRILIEPLVRIMFNGTYILLSITDAAIISMPSFGEGGRTSWIGDYTNRQFPQALYIDENLGLPYDYPVTPVTSTKSSGSYWTNKQIVTTGLGAAVAWVETDPPVNFNKLNIIYNVGDGSIVSDTYSVNSSGNVTKGGSVFKQVKYPYEAIDLYNKSTLGIKAPTGYHNTANYKAYSYSSGGTAYIRKYGQDDNSRTSENFWKNIYYDATSDGSNSAGAGWRYIKSSGSYTQAKALSKYDSDRTVYVYPIYEPNTLTVKFHANGGSGSMANQTFTYNTSQALKTNSFTRTGYKFVGWATSASATAKTYSDKQSVAPTTLSSKIKTQSSTTVDLYAVWAATDPTIGIRIRYSSSGGNIAPSGTSMAGVSFTKYGLGSTSSLVTSVVSSGTVTSTGSSSKDFVWVTPSGKSSPVLFEQIKKGKTDTSWTNGLVNYSTLGLSRSGYVGLQDDGSYGTSSDVSGNGSYLWRHTVYDYYVENGVWKHSSKAVYFNENEDLELPNFWSKVNQVLCKFENKDNKVNKVELTISGTKYTTSDMDELSAMSLSSAANGSTLKVTERLPKIKYSSSSGYTQFNVVVTYTKSGGKWYRTELKRGYFATVPGTSNVGTYYVTVTYPAISTNSSVWKTTTGYGGFSYQYADGSTSGYVLDSSSSDSFPAFNMYARWSKARGAYGFNYNVNGGDVVSSSYGKTDVETANINVASVVSDAATDRDFQTSLLAIPDDAVPAGLEDYATFGLVRDGYGTNGNWRFIAKQYEQNKISDTNIVLYQSGTETKWTRNEKTKFDSTQTAFNDISNGRLLRVSYFKADGTRFSAGDIAEADATTFSNGDYCEAIATHKATSLSDSYMVRVKLVYTNGKWICHEMKAYRMINITEEGDSHNVYCEIDCNCLVDGGSRAVHHTLGLNNDGGQLVYYDDYSSHTTSSVSKVYFTSETTNAKYQEALPIYTLSATWFPYKVNFVTYQKRAKSSDGKWESKNTIGALKTETAEYSPDGIEVPSTAAPFGYHLDRDKWTVTYYEDKTSGLTAGSTMFFKSSGAGENDIQIVRTPTGSNNDVKFKYAGEQFHSDDNNLIFDTTTNAATLSVFSVVKPNILTVVYDNNGGSGDIDSQYGIYSDDITLGSTGITKDGYELVGWNTEPDGSGEPYTLGQVVNAVGLNSDIETQDCTTTLYAQWKAVNGSINVSLTRDTTSNYSVKSTEALNGYTFTLYKRNASGVYVKVTEANTDTSGKISFAGLEYGTYKIEPIQPATSFYITDASKEITVNSQTANSASFQLHNKGNIAVTLSYDATAWASGTTATVGLYSDSGCTTLIESKSVAVSPSASGSVTFTGLATRNVAYYLKVTTSINCHTWSDISAVAAGDIASATNYTVAKTSKLTPAHDGTVKVSVTRGSDAYLNSTSVAGLQFAVYGVKSDNSEVKLSTITTTGSATSSTGSYTVSIKNGGLYKSYVVKPVSTFTDTHINIATKSATSVDVATLRNVLHGHDFTANFETTTDSVGSMTVRVDKAAYMPDDDDLSSLTMKVTLKQGSTTIRTETVTVGDDGKVVLNDLPAGEYTVTLSGVNSPYVAESTNPQTVTVTTGGNTSVVFIVGARGTVIARNIAYCYQGFLTVDDVTAIGGVSLYRDSGYKTAETDTTRSVAAVSTANTYCISQSTTFNQLKMNDAGKVLYIAPTNSIPNCHAIKSSTATNEDCRVSVQDILDAKDSDGKHTYKVIEFVILTTPCTATYDFIVHNKTDVNSGSITFKVTNNVESTVYKSAAMTIKANTDITKSATGVSIVRMKSSVTTTEYTGYTVTYSGVPAGYELVLVKGSETADMAALRSHDHKQTLEYNLVSTYDGSINVSLTRDTTGDYAVKNTEALDGYTFTAYRKNSSGVFVKVKDAVTDADGKISFTGLEYGTYKIEPTQPTGSLYITDTSKEVVINSTTPGSASFQLHNKGTVKVTVNKNAVCWFTETTVKVGLYSGNTLIEEKDVIIGNTVSFTGLKTNGTAYSVKINNIPDCHKSTVPAAIGTTDILNATDYTVSRTITLNIDHSAKINVSVTKDNIAKLSDISVGNLQFEVYGIKAADGTNVRVTTLTTDATGKASYTSSLSAKLIYSGYYVVPVSTFADDEIHFNINKSETVTVDALRADKHGHDADVAFNIAAAPTGSIKVTIDKEDYVPDDDDLDVTVTVTVYDEDGNKIAEEIVNPSEDPVVTFDDLPIGDYTIKISDPDDPYFFDDDTKEVTVSDGDTEDVVFKVGVWGTVVIEPYSYPTVVFHDMAAFKKITGVALYADEEHKVLLYKATIADTAYKVDSKGTMYATKSIVKVPLDVLDKVYYVGIIGEMPSCHELYSTTSETNGILTSDRIISVKDILSVKDSNGKHTYKAPNELVRLKSTHTGSVAIKVINNTGVSVSGVKFVVKNDTKTYTSAIKAVATGTNTYCTLAPVLHNKFNVSSTFIDNTDYTLIPTAPEGYQLKLVSGDMSQLTLENLRVHDHKATFTYELIKNAPTKGDIVVKVSSIATAPSQFSAKWDNPAGKTATVMLYSGTTKVASKTVTIPAKGAAANSVTFADCAFGNYNIVITNPAKDCVYIYNSKQTSSAALAHDVNSQPVEFVMTNFKHTLNIDYDNQFSENLTSAKFVVTLTDVNGKTSSVTVSKGSMTVPACDANGKKYSYTIKMSTAPTNYTLDNKIASFEGYTINKNGNITASFESWYIWDFSIGANLSSAAETTKETYGGFKKGSTVVINVPVTNKRAHQNTPAVSVEVFLDKTRINAQSVTIDANSSKTLSVSVSIPTSASTGAHTVTAYVNYDKYSTYGEGYLYETALTDNTATLTLDVISGDVRIVPVASNSDYYIGDTVFASFYVYNDSAVDILKANNTSIGGKVLYTKTDGTSATKTLTDITGVVVPSNIYVDNRNLVFFKFTVPSDAKPNTDIAVTATIKTGTAMNEDTSNDTAVILKKTRLHAESNTPDPGRNLSAPSGWQASCATPNLTRYAATSTSTAIGKSAKWSVWEENTTGKLTLHTYGATATVNAIVKVDNRCLTAAVSNKDLVMKSGYALTLAVQPSVTKLNETPASMLGSFGSANAYYPEFSYVKEGGKYSALNLINDDALRATSQFTAKSATPAYAATHDMSILNTASRWELPQCTFSSFYKNGAGMARKHFTPLWWKNGNYQIVCDATDFWTPAGVIGAEAVAKTTLGGTVVISGSVYDDYYTVRG